MQSNTSDALNLYAKVEDLLGVAEVAPNLNSYYFEILSDINFKSLLDIGCGRGDFLKKLSEVEPDARLLGIDRSSFMVEQALKCGIEAKSKELKDLNEKFDVATAIFDMVNYLNRDEFNLFFDDLSKVINKGGYFIFDVNSYFGLSQLAVGNFIADDIDRFLAIESFFENRVYESNFTLFEKYNNTYKKSFEVINQYYYSLDDFNKLKTWDVVNTYPINLYGEESIDKKIYILKSI